MRKMGDKIIMKLQDQVVSLEIAKELKELGVVQESLWYWLKCELDGWIVSSSSYRFGPAKNCLAISAFTVAELGDLLDISGMYTSFCGHPKGIDNIILKYSFQEFEANTEANARGKMLVYLIENKIL